MKINRTIFALLRQFIHLPDRVEAMGLRVFLQGRACHIRCVVTDCLRYADRNTRLQKTRGYQFERYFERQQISQSSLSR
jgi:hypothetical protein